MLASALEWQGYRVGTYTSPHLVDFRERIVADRLPIEAEAVTSFLATHERLIEDTGATFFEVTTALAFHWLRESEVDVAVIEVGLGGRLDSTNVVSPLVAGVVSVDIDHVDYLGGSLSSIASEKGGIYKRGVPAVHGAVPAEAAETLRRVAREAGASTLVDAVALYRPRDIAMDRRGTSFLLGEGTPVRVPLAGEHQAGNAAVALAMLRAAGGSYNLPPEHATEAFVEVALPGRFQRTTDTGRLRGVEGAVHGGPEWIFDVAHNPAGISALVRTMANAGLSAPLAAVVSILGDKDWRGMLHALAPHVDRLVLTVAPTALDRAWNLAEVCEWCLDQGIRVECDAGFDRALALVAGSGTVVVTGSFHTVGDAMVALQVDPLVR